MTEITNFRGEVAQPDTGTLPDCAADALLRRVGERVRKARERKGIPRRVLSERSGVSPRYLAQLEAGAGNISIGLLQRVATALGHRIEWLVGEEDPWTSDALRVARLFRVANSDVQQAVLEKLNATESVTSRAQRICLIGLRGAGKSTLGRLGGEALGIPFVELNRDIEDHSGMPIEEVMAFYGQDGYRNLEAQAVRRVIEKHDTLILAVAGGIVAEPETFGLLLNHFHTIWIRTSPEEHMSRVREQGDERPMAGNAEAMEQLEAILSSREPLYEKALAQVDTSGRTVDQSVADLVAVVEHHGFLR
ncbi:helix-turn-helix domain-containing protein [Aquicoccus porphyridii]|uniref:Shikimate kinase n=1 Tax=Aquicoccus porphyridii TaxID=1852029 RepID=A0A5A9ZGH2_9RHOB|nr:helix-turn-helix transcriptional regulator [Aquicoccus porphyridii]KAA0916082.1 helix-turn-helix domain-containing protein [Aquicoccus porphyridii]RAI52721.1 transcriptional regulator [Rhodobacteraceae bacterium AsT-22]